MTDDRWAPPPSNDWPPPSSSSALSRRSGLTAGERLLALEMTDDHHAELHRATAHRLEMGERRMSGHDQGITGLLQREQAREAAREARAAERAAIRATRNQAVQMAVWIAAILTCAITVTNFLAPRLAAPPGITAPAPK